MEYQVSWGIGGDTLLMPSQKDVIRGHIQRYLTANRREHIAISDETIKALETLYGNLNESEADDFTTILSDIVNDILQDEDIAINFYKKDNEAWEEYLGGAKTAENKSLRELLTDYAEATTLYEVHVGSSDYDRLRGQSGYKFGRDMQKLPKFNLDAFKRDYRLKRQIINNPIELEVSVAKKGATKTRGTFEEVLERAQKDRKKQRAVVKEKLKDKTPLAIARMINKDRGEESKIKKIHLDEMKKRYEDGKVKRTLEEQMLRMGIDHFSSLTNFEATARLIDQSLSINYKLRVEPSMMFYQVGQFKGYLPSLEALAQAQIDEKSKQIKERGVVSGGWTSVSGMEIKFNKNMFEEDEYDEEEEEFKGEIFLPAVSLNGMTKDITHFTLSDLVAEDWLKDKNKQKDVFVFPIQTNTLFNQILENSRFERFLDFGLREIDKVTVNVVEVKFVLPSKDKRGTTTTEGAFSQEQQILAKRLSGIKAIANLKTANIAVWDTQTYSRESIRPSRKMQEHLSLFKERVEDLIDYYDVEVSGEVNDMED